MRIAPKERARRPLEAIFVGEKGTEIGGEVRVARQKVGAIRGCSGVDRLEIKGDRLVESLLSLGEAGSEDAEGVIGELFMGRSTRVKLRGVRGGA